MPLNNLLDRSDETARTQAVHSVGAVKGDAEQSPERTESDSAWAPLAVPVFRAFWIASLVSNLGTWVHEVGAGWLMTRLDPTPEMVSAVRVAMSVPMLVLAIPAGVLADRFDRRRLLIVTQLLLFATTATLASLTFTDAITSWLLLGLTFVIGLGMVLHVLAWQSTIPMLVPRRQLSRAIALGSISFNLARAAGPALGGVLIADGWRLDHVRRQRVFFRWCAGGVVLVETRASRAATSIGFRARDDRRLSFCARPADDAQRVDRRVAVSDAGNRDVVAAATGRPSATRLAGTGVWPAGDFAWTRRRVRGQDSAFAAPTSEAVTRTVAICHDGVCTLDCL